MFGRCVTNCSINIGVNKDTDKGRSVPITMISSLMLPSATTLRPCCSCSITPSSSSRRIALFHLLTTGGIGNLSLLFTTSASKLSFMYLFIYLCYDFDLVSSLLLLLHLVIHLVISSTTISITWWKRITIVQNTRGYCCTKSSPTRPKFV